MKILENKMVFDETNVNENGHDENKTTIFDLGPKERYRMLKEVKKHKMRMNACKL